MWTDSHCHLTDEAFSGEGAEVLRRARQSGVDRLVVIACRAEDFEGVLDLAASEHGIVVALGIHPEEAGKLEPDALDRLRTHLDDPQVRAVGEVGLDYHWHPDERHLQWRLLEDQIGIAEAAGLPLVIHEREAWEDLVRILDGVRPRVLLHSFSHGPDELHVALERGWYVAFGGIATFHSAKEVRQAAVEAPLDRLLLETDAPYLAPDPFRGQRNEPRHVATTGTFLASLRGRPPEDLAVATTRSAQDFFGPWAQAGD